MIPWLKMVKFSDSYLFFSDALFDKGEGCVTLSVDGLQLKNKKSYKPHHLAFIFYDQANVFLVFDANSKTIPCIKWHLGLQLFQIEQTNMLAKEPKPWSQRTENKAFNLRDLATFAGLVVCQRVELLVGDFASCVHFVFFLIIKLIPIRYLNQLLITLNSTLIDSFEKYVRVFWL